MLRRRVSSLQTGALVLGVGAAGLLLLLLWAGQDDSAATNHGRLLRALAPAAAAAEEAHPVTDVTGAGADAAHGPEDAAHGDGAGGHGAGDHESIFMQALSLDQRKVGMMMAFIVVAQLVLDGGLRRVEGSVGASSKVLLAEIYKELATLGIISFILFLVQSFASNMDTALLHAFEYSHLLIFAFAVCYIIQSALLIASIKPIKRQLIKQNAEANETTVQGRPVSLAYWGFQVFRNKFISRRQLPPTFLYDRYLTEIYNGWVELKLEISSWCWAFIVGVFVLHILVSMAGTKLSHALLHPATFVIYGWLIFALDLCIYLIVRRAHNRVLGKLQGDLQAAKASSFKLSKQYSERHNALQAVKERRVELFQAMEAQHTGSGSHGSDVTKGDSSHADANADMVDTQDEGPAPALAAAGKRASSGGSGRMGASHGGGSGGILRHHHHEMTYDDSDDEGKLNSEYGFLPWEAFAFDKGSQLLSVSRCLYLATFLVAYLVPSYHEYKTWEAVLITILVPLPAILAAIYIIPRMVTRYLLVRSLSSVDLNALDSVVEYMEEVEESFETISFLLKQMQAKGAGVTLEQIFKEFDTDGSGSLSYAELGAALKKNDIHLHRRQFKALVRFVDADLNGDVNLEEFQGLLKGDHVFLMDGCNVMQKTASTDAFVDAPSTPTAAVVEAGEAGVGQ